MSICCDQLCLRGKLVAARQERQCSETNGAKAQPNSCRASADSRARNHASWPVIFQCAEKWKTSDRPSFFVPTFDLVCDYRSSFQRKPVEQPHEFRSAGVFARRSSAMAPTIYDPVDRIQESKLEAQGARKQSRFLGPLKFINVAHDQNSATHPANGIAMRIIRTQFRQSPEELHERRNHRPCPGSLAKRAATMIKRTTPSIKSIQDMKMSAATDYGITEDYDSSNPGSKRSQRRENENPIRPGKRLAKHIQHAIGFCVEQRAILFLRKLRRARAIRQETSTKFPPMTNHISCWRYHERADLRRQQEGSIFRTVPDEARRNAILSKPFISL